VFVESKYVNVDGGRHLKDHEIAGMLIATLFAGQHTSSITSSWTGYFMLTNKVSPRQNTPSRIHTAASLHACELPPLHGWDRPESVEGEGFLAENPTAAQRGWHTK